MTGRFPQHVNMHNLALSVPGAGIPLGMTTIATKLKAAGYATHAVVRAQQHPAPGPSHRRHVRHARALFPGQVALARPSPPIAPRAHLTTPSHLTWLDC